MRSVMTEPGSTSEARPFGFLKRRQVEVLREQKQQLLAWAGSHIWQHHALYIYDPDGLNGPFEMLPGKWYHTDETQAEVFGPFDDAYHAALALRGYFDAFLAKEAEDELSMFP